MVERAVGDAFEGRVLVARTRGSGGSTQGIVDGVEDMGTRKIARGRRAGRYGEGERREVVKTRARRLELRPTRK